MVKMARFIADLDILGEDEFAEALHRSRGLVNVDIHHDAVAKLGQQKVSVDSPLAIEPERLPGDARLQVLQLLREHAVEELAAILAGDDDRSSMRAVEQTGAPSDRRVFGLDV